MGLPSSWFKPEGGQGADAGLRCASPWLPSDRQTIISVLRCERELLQSSGGEKSGYCVYLVSDSQILIWTSDSEKPVFPPESHVARGLVPQESPLRLILKVRILSSTWLIFLRSLSVVVQPWLDSACAHPIGFTA